MKYVVANWKMNMDLKTIEGFVDGFSGMVKNIPENVTPIICPSSVHTPLLVEAFKKTKVKIGAQDISLVEKGAHTGEVGAFQIKEFCEYSIIGHSEHKDSKEEVLKKRDLCLKSEITPIICFVNPQDLKDLNKEGVIICWEDPKNISKNGVYHVEDPKKVEAIALEIRKIIGDETPLLYGGSVNEENIKEIASISHLDGVLVGNASLDPIKFANIIRTYA